MATLDTDLEKAFTNGDPEAVLDFLVIRSRQVLRSEDEEDPACSVPLFTSDNDMAAFVRDLTIDDAIAHCFADLPSDCGDSVTSSTRGLLPSRPEKKLTDSKIAAEAEPIQKHPPEASSRSATVKQQSPSRPAVSSSPVSGGNSRGKSRGFLSSLLGRGHKGRRGNAQRKPAHHYQDTSSRHSDVTLSGFSSEDDKRKVASDCEAVVHERLNGKSVPECLSESSLLPGDLAEVHGKQAGVGKQQTEDIGHQHMASLQVRDGRVRQVTSDSDPVCVIEYCLSHSSARDLDSVEHKLETAVQPSNPRAASNPSVHRKPPAVGGFGSSNRCAHTLAKRPHGNDHQVYPYPHVPNALSSPPKHTETSASNQPVGLAGNVPNTIHTYKERMLPSQTHPQAPTCPASEKSQTSAVVHSAEHTHNPHGGKDQKLTPQQPWEGICDGVDAFIDFERDPNLEVPLDCHLSAQFDFECRSSEGRFQRGEEQDQVLVNRPQVSGRSEAPHWTLQTPEVTSTEQGIRAGDENPGTENVPPNSSTLMCTSRSQNLGQCPQATLMTPSKVSASTQTENSDLELAEGSVHRRVSHCLRTAITQLSALSACSTCHDVITRTLADLKKALSETGGDFSCGNNRIPEPVPHGQSGVPRLEKQTDNALLNEGLADQPGVESSPPSAHPTEPGSPGHNRSQDSETDLQGHPVSDLKTGPQNSALSKPSQSRSYPEQSTQRSKQSGVGKKQMTSSRASVDSDSASTSTVTSEPITVLVCQRGNRSSSGSSKVGGPPNKVVSAASSFSVDVDSAKAGTSQSSDPTPPFVMDANPALDSSAAKTKPNAVMQPATTIGAVPPFRAGPSRPRKDARHASRYAGEADRDYESFMTSSWSEMTSVSSVSDIVTSADESSYYSGDDDDNEDEDEEEDDDLTTVVRLGLLDEDRDDSELRQHRLQRHLAAVLRQTSIPTSTVETVVAATGERLNGQERPVNHVNQGSLYPFSPRPAVHGAVGHDAAPPAFVPAPAGPRGESCLPPSAGLHAAISAASSGREARSARKSKKGVGPRLFSPDRQVSLISARQMTSEEFREGYDRSTDIAKAKRSQLDGDIPWDLIPCSDTDDDAGSDKAWYNVTSEDDSLAHAYGSDTDSSTTVSDW